jgi:hypothetical protein
MTGTLQYHRGYTDMASVEGGKPGDPIRFVASTPGVKRDGLDLRTNGWKLDNFRKSPVKLWCHDKTSLPIGVVKAETDARLVADVVYDQQDDFARKVESKYRRGFLHAVSVGWDFVDDKGQRLNVARLSMTDIRDRAFYDLTELSGVPVPADPEALKEATRAGLRSLSRELATLFDDQESEHGELNVEEVRAAVWAEVERLGIPLEVLRHNAEQPDNRAVFVIPPVPAPAVSGIDKDAARSLLAAFQFEGVK